MRILIGVTMPVGDSFCVLHSNAVQLRVRDVVAGEYLYHWRAVALPLLGPEWELRYVVLHGTTLK